MSMKIFWHRRAEILRDQPVSRIRAPDYSGGTYALTYDPQQDQLRGIYFQAVRQ